MSTTGVAAILGLCRDEINMRSHCESLLLRKRSLSVRMPVG
ncbi:hypothetical protein [uncultured Nostoc sp.]|nr:hypothetical protein [uncultured Nostoc sp.]